jgi:hypothetical protein
MIEDEYKFTVENINRTVKNLQVCHQERGGYHYWYLNELQLPTEWIMRLNPITNDFEICREVTIWFEQVSTDDSYTPRSCRTIPKTVRKLRKQYETKLIELKEQKIRDKLTIMAGDFEECD